MNLDLQQVSKRFGAGAIETTAVDHASLSVGEGDFIAIQGQSGSGKSTLLSLAGLLDRPSDGRVAVDGRDISRASDSELAALRQQKLGFVFQAFHLIPHLSVRRNVDLALSGGDLGRAERKSRVDEVLETFGLAARAGHLPSQLSGGQQQRVALARAVVRRPALLICDEPTGNLDASNGQIVMDALRRLNQGGTAILLVTHSDEIAEVASRRYWMRDGVLAPLAPADKLAH